MTPPTRHQPIEQAERRSLRPSHERSGLAGGGQALPPAPSRGRANQVVCQLHSSRRRPTARRFWRREVVSPGGAVRNPPRRHRRAWQNLSQRLKFRPQRDLACCADLPPGSGRAVWDALRTCAGLTYVTRPRSVVTRVPIGDASDRGPHRVPVRRRRRARRRDPRERPRRSPARAPVHQASRVPSPQAPSASTSPQPD